MAVKRRGYERWPVKAARAFDYVAQEPCSETHEVAEALGWELEKARDTLARLEKLGRVTSTVVNRRYRPGLTRGRWALYHSRVWQVAS